jgi:hypothetical protein
MADNTVKLLSQIIKEPADLALAVMAYHTSIFPLVLAKILNKQKEVGDE